MKFKLSDTQKWLLMLLFLTCLVIAAILGFVFWVVKQVTPP